MGWRGTIDPMARRAQGRKPRRPERPSLAPWLSLAATAHAALFVAALAAKTAGVRASAPADPALDPLWLDLVAADSAEAAPASSASDAPARASAPSAPISPSAGAGPRGMTARRTAEPSAAVARRPLAALGQEALGRDALGSEPPSRETTSEAAKTASPGAPGEVASPAPGGEASGNGGAEGAGPHLSLRDLGVDRGSNPFIGSASELPTERQLLNQRLRQSLRSEIAKQDQARALGPEGPAVRAVTDIVMASASAPNTTALLRVRTDAAGAVTLVDVLEADRDSAEWQRIADQLVRALAGKKLRVPAGANGVSFQLRVVSRVQLPSGADPGLAIDALGIPLKKGDGKRSTKLSILSPMVTEIEVPDSNGLRVPVVTFSLIGAMADPTDIGAVARRLVTAYLVAMDTDVLPENAAPPAPSPAPAAAP